MTAEINSLASKRYVSSLIDSAINGELGIAPDELSITGASYIYQTTQFPSSNTKYHNYYLLMRVESYFGACAHTPDQLGMNIAEEWSGRSLLDALKDTRLPVKIAALDAYLGVVKPHSENCMKTVTIHGGTPLEKANARDKLIAEIAFIKPSKKVALIGVVNPLIEAITKLGGICLPCDLQMEETQWGEIVEKDMDKVLANADSVICTAMTLGNGTFDHILGRAKERGIPVTVYAQTGSAIAAYFVGSGIYSLVAEPFPFSQFSASNTEVYCYAQKDY
jgi:hypothetical protein